MERWREYTHWNLKFVNETLVLFLHPSSNLCSWSRELKIHFKHVLCNLEQILTQTWKTVDVPLTKLITVAFTEVKQYLPSLPPDNFCSFWHSWEKETVYFSSGLSAPYLDFLLLLFCYFKTRFYDFYLCSQWAPLKTKTTKKSIYLPSFDHMQLYSPMKLRDPCCFKFHQRT